MNVRYLAAMWGAGLMALTSGCRLGATARLHEEPARIDVVYCEAAPITIVAPSGDTSAQASRTSRPKGAKAVSEFLALRTRDPFAREAPRPATTLGSSRAGGEEAR